MFARSLALTMVLAAGSSVGLAQRLARSRLARAGEVFLKLAGGLLVAYGGYLAWEQLAPMIFSNL